LFTSCAALPHNFRSAVYLFIQSSIYSTIHLFVQLAYFEMCE
jgi:hypothetical protein